MGARLDVVELHKAFEHGGRLLEVLRGITFSLEAGEMAAIVGASGVGKSTLLHILGTLDLPTSGQLRYDGLDITTLSSGQLAEFRNRTIGFVFQFHHLLPEFTALENVMMPCLIHRVPRREAEARARRILDRVGLSNRVTHKPGELSGGEQQRVALARAMVLEPSVLLADEPTGNLDSHTGAEIHDLLVELNRERGSTMLIVTHNPELAALMPRTLRMVDGGLVDSGGDRSGGDRSGRGARPGHPARSGAGRARGPLGRGADLVRRGGHSRARAAARAVALVGVASIAVALAAPRPARAQGMGADFRGQLTSASNLLGLRVDQVQFRGNRKVEDDAIRANLLTRAGSPLELDKIREDMRVDVEAGLLQRRQGRGPEVAHRRGHRHLRGVGEAVDPQDPDVAATTSSTSTRSTRSSTSSATRSSTSPRSSRTARRSTTSTSRRATTWPTVDYQLKPVNESEVDVWFVVHERSKVEIRNVSFIGNQQDQRQGAAQRHLDQARAARCRS